MSDRLTRDAGLRVLVALGLVALVSLIGAGSAFAIYDHSEVQDEFTVGCDAFESGQIEDIAVDEDDEVLYVFCERGFGQPAPRVVIEKLDYEGNPVAFDVTKSYVSGNLITGNPAAGDETLNTGFAGGHIAVDNSGGPHDGEIYVYTGASGAFAGTENISIFRETGEFAGVIEQPELAQGAGNGTDVEVGPDGSVYFLTSERLSKYGPAYNEVARMYTTSNPTFIQGNKIAVDNKGAAWVMQTGPVKYEPDQLFPNFSPAFGSNKEKFTGSLSPYVPVPIDSGLSSGMHIAVDPGPARNDLYLARGNGIDVYSEGTPAVPAYKNAPRIGQNLGGGNAITVTKDNRIFTSYFDTSFGADKKIIVFGPGEIIPDVFTHAADVEDVGHDGAELTAEVKLDGGTAIQSCQLEVGPSKGNYTEVPVACTPSSFGTDSVVSAEITGLDTGSEYHFRFSATNENGTNFGGDRTFTPAYVLNVKTLPATSIDENGATLEGQLNPDGKATDYYFEYGVDETYGLKTETLGAGSVSGTMTVGAPVEGLPAARTFHYRIVASNEDGTTVGEDRTFRTASTPGIYGLRTSNLTETSATLHATIDPVGYPTTYRFEYGPSTAYGQSIPVPDESIGSGNEPVEVDQTVTGLTPGVTYHFRVVATNEPWGTSFSSDTTFDFAPPTCPNDHARQETAATYLPDCRGYELVSPGEAGAVQLFPGKEAWDLYDNLQEPLVEDGMWPLNNGLASSPPRLMFYGMLGSIDGLRAPNLLSTDSYLATRTSNGWVTTLPGFTDELETPSQKQCSDSMHLCFEFNTPITDETMESQAYVHTAEGEFQEKLPQNSNLVPGSNEYKGFKRTSPDFSNFVFSSTTTEGLFGVEYPGVAFTVDGQTTGAGSAYDNDLENRTVTLISRLPGTAGGGHIPQNGTSTRPIQFPGISADGSHVLMLTEGGFPDNPAGPPYRLYMRVNNAVSYDVSKGVALEFVGMTRDGSSVTFTSEEQLDSADTDSSVDLYRWEEATDSVSLVSVGNNAGNEDACNANWVEGCGIEVPDTERRWPMVAEIPFGNSGVPVFQGQGLDDLTAEHTGDVYFFSPESLDGSKPGIPDQRNLFVARPNGQVQMVGTLDAGTGVYRMTIARDGRFASFLTDSRMTGYENGGYRQVYLYDRDAETIVCASCRPGAPPANDISVSQGGKFMSDAGQVFFDSKDSLVPRDKNGEITDTYEYVGGRPQLISSGLAARDFTGGAEILGLFAQPEFTGLEAVSRDGTDVYFSTFASLVDEDQNGQYIKFYDARTNGGFAQPPVDAPCAAADECHGTDSSPPAPPVVTSGVQLGNTGNVQQQKKKANKRKKARKKRQARKRRQAARKRKRARMKRRQMSHARAQEGRSNG